MEKSPGRQKGTARRPFGNSISLCYKLSKELDRRGLSPQTAAARGEGVVRSLICNADPTALYGALLTPSLVPSFLRRRAREIVPSYGAFYAYVVTDMDLGSLGIDSAAIQHWDSVDAVFEADWSRWDQFKHFLLSCTTLKDSEHAPPGQHILELAAPAPFEPFSSTGRISHP